MRSLWMDPEEQHYPQLDRDVDVDVAIVGAGLSGVGAAYALRDKNVSVVVLEERTVASGASGRNGGFVLAGPATVYSDACDLMGTEAAYEVWTLTLQNNRFISDLVDQHGIECGYLRRGSMSLAISEDEWRILERSHQCLDAAGIRTCLATADQLPKPFDRMYLGGMYYPGNAEIEPAAFVRALAARLGAAVSVYERTPVTGLKQDDGLQLQTPRGTVRARTALLATNALTPRLLPQMPITPRRGQVLSTEPLNRVVVPFPMYANHGYQYWKQTAGGRLVIGGWRDLDFDREVTFEEQLHQGIQTALEGFSRHLAPDAAIEHRWAGIMGFSPNMLPFVGSVPEAEDLYIAAAYSGHGVAMAFTCGYRVALRAIGEQADIPESFSPGRVNVPAGISG